MNARQAVQAVIEIVEKTPYDDIPGGSKETLIDYLRVFDKMLEAIGLEGRGEGEHTTLT